MCSGFLFLFAYPTCQKVAAVLAGFILLFIGFLLLPFLQRNGLSRDLALVSSTFSGWLWDKKQLNSCNIYFSYRSFVLRVRGAALMPREAPSVPINSCCNSKLISWDRDQPKRSWSSTRGTFHPQVWKSSSWQIQLFFGSAAFQRNRMIFHAHRKAEENGGIIKLQELNACFSVFPLWHFESCFKETFKKCFLLTLWYYFKPLCGIYHLILSK